MKILKRITFGLGIASLMFFQACTDDVVDPNNNGNGGNNNGGTNKTCKITKAVADDGTEETYTWDGDQLVKLVEVDSAGTIEYNFNYTGGQLTEIVEGTNTSYKMSYTGNKITSVEYSEGGALMTVSKINYNNEGKFNTIEDYEIDGGQEVLAQRYTYMYTDSKLKKINILTDLDGNGDLNEDDDLLTTMEVAALDSKKSPFYNLPTVWMDFADFRALFENNVNAMIITIFGIPVPFSSTYEYNEHNYPTKANFVANGETTVMDITYSCE